jgi:hypothetical protein
MRSKPGSERTDHCHPYPEDNRVNPIRETEDLLADHCKKGTATTHGRGKTLLVFLELKHKNKQNSQQRPQTRDATILSNGIGQRQTQNCISIDFDDVSKDQNVLQSLFRGNLLSSTKKPVGQPQLFEEKSSPNRDVLHD